MPHRLDMLKLNGSGINPGECSVDRCGSATAPGPVAFPSLIDPAFSLSQQYDGRQGQSESVTLNSGELCQVTVIVTHRGGSSEEV